VPFAGGAAPAPGGISLGSGNFSRLLSSSSLRKGASSCAPRAVSATPPLFPPRTNWTRRVPHPVLTGHDAELRDTRGGPFSPSACPQGLAVAGGPLGLQVGWWLGQSARDGTRVSCLPYPPYPSHSPRALDW
jgi:hypothetical protein